MAKKTQTPDQLLKDVMKKLGITPADLALLLDRTPRSIRSYLSGDQAIPTDVWTSMELFQRIDKEELEERLVRVRAKNT